jgi:hypothetical protein
MPRHIVVAIIVVLVAATLVPGCRLKPRAALPVLPEPVAPAQSAAIRSVYVPITSGLSAKHPAEPVTVMLRWRDQTIATETLARGERWEPNTTRAVEFRLAPPIRLEHAGGLVLQIQKPDIAPDQHPWSVQIEALARLTDGTVLNLLDRTEPLLLGAGGAMQVSWTLRAP